jgi:DNA-directed RNA polymerase
MKVADMTEVQVEQITGYKQARARNIDAEIKRKSKLLTAAQIRALANEYNGRKFYLPMSMDFRGRSYYVPLYLSPMSTSLARGLLRLADGQPFGTQEAVDWFLVTGANHAGADKTNYAGRIQWVKDHHSLIMQTAADPVTNKWWMTVGKESWEFLSWAMEYARWKDEGGRLDFVSHICCNIDATCSGLQILSAMALDEKGGYSVNLTETDEPQDIYGEVAAITIEKLVANSKELQGDTFKAMSKKMSPVEISRICRMLVNSGLIDRGATKRACMTFVYGVTKHGVQDQLVQYFNKLEDEGTDIPFDNVFDASLVLKEVLFEAVKEVVVKGTEVMEWLQEIARVTAKKGLPLRWRTSHGFLVTQSYRNMSKVTVETQISGRCTLILNEYGTKIAPGKQVSSIVPNAVHAIDANLMLDTIYTMSQELPDAPFSAIHDSYGSLACHLPRLSQVVRECFVKLFSEDLLQKFKDDIEADTGLCLDPPENDVCSKLHMPFKGKLVVADVLKSKYFFS